MHCQSRVYVNDVYFSVFQLINDKGYGSQMRHCNNNIDFFVLLKNQKISKT